ncbi:MAG: helix-turn-helix transcriptional regulator [Planctomycetaceae bacterium]|nr:helix-turn-helix transcriptional regulator [Planctomycetaceae bacterium]
MEQARSANIDFNANLGRKLSFLRQNRRLSQGELGDLIGVRAQQIHKYETGENRLSAERLKNCADILGVSINYFFIEKLAPFNIEDHDLLQLVSEFYSVPNDIRVDFLALIRTLRQFSQQYQTSFIEQEDKSK